MSRNLLPGKWMTERLKVEESTLDEVQELQQINDAVPQTQSWMRVEGQDEAEWWRSLEIKFTPTKLRRMFCLRNLLQVLKAAEDTEIPEEISALSPDRAGMARPIRAFTAQDSRPAAYSDSEWASTKPPLIRLHISSGSQPSPPIRIIIFSFMFDIIRDIITGIALVIIATAIPPAAAPSTAARI
jgi:hypothetical protein